MPEKDGGAPPQTEAELLARIQYAIDRNAAATMAAAIIRNKGFSTAEEAIRIYQEVFDALYPK